MNLVKDVWEPLPKPAKVVIGVGAGIIAFRAGKKIYHKLNPGPGEEEVATATTEAQNILKNNATLPADQRQLPTYTPAQMTTFANSLFSAMDGSGTDEETIDSVFSKMQNDLDVLLLIDKFGVRASSYNLFGSPTPLSDWLAGDGMVQRVNTLLDTKAKITMRF